jgi:hypothetical protein
VNAGACTAAVVGGVACVLSEGTAIPTCVSAGAAGLKCAQAIQQHNKNEPDPDGSGQASGPEAVALPLIQFPHSLIIDPGPDGSANGTTFSSTSVLVSGRPLNTDPGPDNSLTNTSGICTIITAIRPGDPFLTN